LQSATIEKTPRIELPSIPTVPCNGYNPEEKIELSPERIREYSKINEARRKLDKKLLLNNMKKLDPEGEFMSCFGSTDPVTGKHKTECKPANPDDVDMDRLFIAQDSPAHKKFGGEPVCNG